MPNNNPAGHNQYTRSDTSSDASGGEYESTQTPASSAASSSTSTGAHTRTETTHTPAKRGFAAMDEAMQRTIASKGGQSQGKANNPGNFANNRERAREAGRKGGEAHGHRANRAPADHQTHHP